MRKSFLLSLAALCLSLGALPSVAQQQNAAMAKGMSIASAGAGALGTIQAAKDCVCQAEGASCSASWYMCATLPIHLLTTIASLMDAGQNGSQEDAIAGEEAPAGGAASGSGAGEGGDFGGLPTLPNFSTAANGEAPAAIFDESPLKGWDAAEEVCSKSPESFICQADPMAALDGLKDSYQQAYASGALGAGGENGLPPGQSLDEALANFDKAKGQLTALLANSDAFKKGKKVSSNNATSQTTGVGGNAITALKENKNGASFGGMPSKYFIENGLEIIDEASGRPLTLWQRATNRYRGTQSQRINTLARMESLRQNALKYLKGHRPTAPVVASQSSPAARAPAALESPTRNAAIPH